MVSTVDLEYIKKEVSPLLKLPLCFVSIMPLNCSSLEGGNM